MNWIIRNKKKLKYHTNLNELLSSEWIDLDNYNWFLSDIELTFFEQNTLLDINQEYFKLSSEEFKLFVKSESQVIWGIISAIKKNEEIIFDSNNLPFADGNSNLWENDNLQIENSVLEIIAWDSSYTILKFLDENLSKKFKESFDEAIELDKYKFK